MAKEGSAEATIRNIKHKTRRKYSAEEKIRIVVEGLRGEQTIADFVAYYNHERYHESLDNVTPADVFFGRQQEVLTQREIIKQRTLQQRRRHHLRIEEYAV